MDDMTTAEIAALLGCEAPEAPELENDGGALAAELAEYKAEQAKAAEYNRRVKANAEAIRRGRGHRNTGAQDDWEGWVF